MFEGVMGRGVVASGIMVTLCIPTGFWGHTEDVLMSGNLCFSLCVDLPGKWQEMTCKPILTLACQMHASYDMHADVFRSEGYWCLQLSLKCIKKKKNELMRQEE